MSSTRTSGKSGALMWDVTPGANGLPVLLANPTQWSLDESKPEIDLTAMGDTSAVFDLGIGASKGTFDVIYSMTSGVIGTLCDGQERTFYLYPNKASYPTVYWFGSARCSRQSDGALGAAVKATLAFACTALTPNNI